MQKIKLEHESWQLYEAHSLGPAGGFGEVFLGEGSAGPVAIKRLKLTASAAAHRELKIGQVLAKRTLQHVVPVLDYGQDADTDLYYLVMPVCEHSLQQILDNQGRLTWEYAKAAILEIIAGLSEVGDIVHRDLKPGNVLWHEGAWKVADFGIAKFVEDSTSLETLRRALTPPYAAPEQWLGEPSSHATDVYALGCIVHAMINGQPPFTGDLDSIQKAHLNSEPPKLEGVDARLNGLVRSMLRKGAESRPTLQRCKSVLEATSAAQRPRNNALEEAGNEVAQAEAAAETQRRTFEAKMRKRAELTAEAIRQFKTIVTRLFDEIEASAESTRRHGPAITLGPARLMSEEPSPVPYASHHGRAPSGWDILAYSTLSLRATTEGPPPGPYTFSATTLFARTPHDQDLRWQELSFFSVGIGRRMSYLRTNDNPIALLPMFAEFNQAISATSSAWHIAYGPLPIDAEDEDTFRERWINLFAKAARKRLHPPSYLPLALSFFA